MAFTRREDGGGSGSQPKDGWRRFRRTARSSFFNFRSVAVHHRQLLRLSEQIENIGLSVGCHASTTVEEEKASIAKNGAQMLLQPQHVPWLTFRRQGFPKQWNYAAAMNAVVSRLRLGSSLFSPVSSGESICKREHRKEPSCNGWSCNDS